MLGEFTHKAKEMTLERDLIGLGTLAVYCGLFRDKRGFAAIASSAKSLLKDLQWSSNFKSVIEGLLDARPRSMLEVAVSFKELPETLSLDLSRIQLKSSNSSLLNSDRYLFQQDSARGSSAYRGVPTPAGVDEVNAKTPVAADRLQTGPAMTQRTVEAQREKTKTNEVQIGTERTQFNYSKGYVIPAELKDPDDIDYSRSIPPKTASHLFSQPPVSLAMQPKSSLGQSVPRSEALDQSQSSLGQSISQLDASYQSKPPLDQSTSQLDALDQSKLSLGHTTSQFDVLDQSFFPRDEEVLQSEGHFDSLSQYEFSCSQILV